MEWEDYVKKFRKKPLHDFNEAGVHRVDFGREEIQKLIPHRDPFLLIDTIDAVDFNHMAIRGGRFISPEDPVFRGHFPGYPIYPGALQLEMVGQMAICYYSLQKQGHANPPQKESSLGVRALKVYHTLFQHELLPGDRAVIIAKYLESDDFKFTGIGQVIKDDKVCTIVIGEFYLV